MIDLIIAAVETAMPQEYDTGGLVEWNIADAILAMPEIEAIRQCILSLACLHYNEGYPIINDIQRTSVYAGLVVGGRLSDPVIEWILS